VLDVRARLGRLGGDLMAILVIVIVILLILVLLKVLL
jgi:hypothetical protein